MSYIQILKCFGFEIENMKEKNEFKDLNTNDLINSYETFFIKTSTNYQKYNDNVCQLNLELFNQASSYTSNSSLQLHELKQQSKKLDIDLNNNDNIERDKLNEEISKYNQAKDEFKEKLINLNSNVLDNLKDLEDRTNEINNLIDSNIEPVEANYNKYIKEFNNSMKYKYSLEHSKLSKSSYASQDLCSNLEFSLSEKNKETLDEINSLKKDVETNKTTLRQDILSLDIDLNNKIRLLDSNTKEMKEQNSLQTEIQKDQTRKKIQELENKSLEQIRLINAEAKENLIRLDSIYTNKIKYFDRKIEEKVEERNIKIKKNNEEYDVLVQLYKDNFNNLNLIEKHQKRIELKNKYKKNKLYEKASSLEILKLNQEKLKLLSKNKLERDLIESKRKYKFGLEDIKEKKEKHPYLNELKIFEEEKRAYDKILETRLTIDSNKEKTITDIAKLNKNLNFNMFEGRKQKNINEKSFESYSLIEEINLNKENLKLELDANETKDKISKRYFESTALLEIEKNKHLSHLNEERIKYNKATNNLYLDYINKNRNLGIDKYKDLIKEFSRFNDEYIKIFQNMCSSSISYNHTKTSDLKTINEVNTRIDISKKSFHLQTIKKTQFLELLKQETQVFTDLLNDFIKVILNNQIVSLTRENKEFVQEFISLASTTLDKLVDKFLSNISNSINLYIYYNSLNISRRLVDSLNYTYNQKIESLNSLINEYDINIKSLIKTNNQYYSKINDLTLVNNQLRYNSLENKESKSIILNNESKISNLKNRIKTNYNKINSYNEIKEKDSKKLSSLKQELEDKTNKLTKIEEKDSIYSANYIEKANELLKSYQNLNNPLLKLENNLDTYNFKYIDFKNKTLRNITLLSNKLHIIYKEYNLKINNTLSKIKEYNEKTYNQDTIQASTQLSIDEASNRKDMDKYNLLLSESKEVHNDNKDNIIHEYEKKFKNLKSDYDVNYNQLKNEFDKKIIYYFDLFNSCEELISVQDNLYNSNLTKINNTLDANKASNSKTFETNKNKNLTKVSQDNTNLSYDISIMPKLKKVEEKSLTNKNDLTNKELNLNIVNINKELKQYKKDLSNETNLLNKETKTNIKILNVEYNKQAFNSRKTYYNSLKKIYKMRYRDLKSGTNN